MGIQHPSVGFQLYQDFRCLFRHVFRCGCDGFIIQTFKRKNNKIRENLFLSRYIYAIILFLVICRLDNDRYRDYTWKGTKMVARKISKNKYGIALLITITVFTLGLLLGLVIDSKRVDLITFKDQEQRLDLQSLQLQYQFADQFADQRDCSALVKTFDNNIRTLEKTRQRIETYQKDTSLNDKEFDLLKREYTIAQLNYWMLYTKSQRICNLDSATILYFFADTETCSTCDSQAIVLTWLKHKFDTDLLTFVFDGKYDKEPMVTLLKAVYNITEYPTLVVGNETIVGFQSRKVLLHKICAHNITNEVCET
jgi:thiol-disulfide isomerase/thioredoxin